MKPLGIILVLIGFFAECVALLFGFAAVGGGYYPYVGDGTAGWVSGAILVTLYRDFSIAIIFWLGLAVFVAGLWLAFRKRRH